MPGQNVYEIAPLPGKLSTPIPPKGQHVFGDRAGDLIMGIMRTSGVADAGRVGKKVYLANFTFRAQSLDPRNLTRVPNSSSGFYPSVFIFKRSKASKGFTAFCAIDMPTEEAAQTLIAAVIQQGTIKREVKIVPGAKKYTPVKPEQELNALSVEVRTNGDKAPLQIAIAKAKTQQKKDDVEQQYFNTFAKAMNAKSPTERLRYYEECKLLIARGGGGGGLADGA